jgi:uncharacterized protein (TIGR03083 family)
VDPKDLAEAERADLVELLATLSPAQWDAPSLCAGWRVREVVAHMFSWEDLGLAGIVRRLVKGGLSQGRANAIGVAELASTSTDELLEMARRHLMPRGLTTGFGGRIALLDALVHHQDIRRPLRLPREIPAERLVCALRFARMAPPVGGPKRMRGLTLTATDLGWSTGRGPVVEGPGEALLMAVAGRRGAVGQLSGPGQPTLAGRIDASGA